MKRHWTAIALALSLVFVSACGKAADPAAAGHDGHGQHAGDGKEAAVPDSTKAVWKLSAAKPQAGANTTVSVQIQDAQGKPVEKFDLNHEKMMHLIIVSQDLSVFDHIHPVYKGGGLFEIDTRFPSGGEYKLFADYVPTGGAAVTKSERIAVDGPKAAPVPIAADAKLTKTLEGKEVTLSYDHLMANMEIKLNFHLVDAKTKKPITDLQPYLGAVGHVVILSADGERYLHVHPTDEKAKGPDASFMTTFPAAGTYKIWGQFQQNGQTFIVPFVVNVP
ncbi:hypothetical protein ACFFNY_25885 [Paenibacillus hodogayensis]|uniref:Secreted protein n=1 Tax=Paenibacillus hodogayensis TaxID=279208 RepID=A0ABV5W3A4_9BACL